MGKLLGYNGIFGKNSLSLIAHSVKISATIKFLVKEVTRSLVQLHNLVGEFIFLNNIIGTPIFKYILCEGILDGVCMFKNSVGKLTASSLLLTISMKK